MSSLNEIADAKVRAAVTRRLDALTPAIVSIRQEMFDRNLLPSCMTVTRMHGACISLFDEIRDGMKAGYGMVLDIMPFSRPSHWVISKALCHFDIVANRAENEIKSATQNLMNSSMHKQLCNDVAIARNRALTDLSLFN